MGRSSWKPFFIGKDFIQQFTISNENTVSKKQDTENQENGFTKIQHLPKIDDLIIYNRGTVIRQYMVGLKVQVYNGIRFFLVEINSEMIGHCLGEFAPTRKKPIPKKKKKKK